MIRPWFQRLFAKSRWWTQVLSNPSPGKRKWSSTARWCWLHWPEVVVNTALDWPKSGCCCLYFPWIGWMLDHRPVTIIVILYLLIQHTRRLQQQFQRNKVPKQGLLIQVLAFAVWQTSHSDSLQSEQMDNRSVWLDLPSTIAQTAPCRQPSTRYILHKCPTRSWTQNATGSNTWRMCLVQRRLPAVAAGSEPKGTDSVETDCWQTDSWNSCYCHRQRQRRRTCFPKTAHYR